MNISTYMIICISSFRLYLINGQIRQCVWGFCLYKYMYTCTSFRVKWFICFLKICHGDKVRLHDTTCHLILERFSNVYSCKSFSSVTWHNFESNFFSCFHMLSIWKDMSCMCLHGILYVILLVENGKHIYFEMKFRHNKGRPIFLPLV